MEIKQGITKDEALKIIAGGRTLAETIMASTNEDAGRARLSKFWQPIRQPDEITTNVA